MSTNLELIQSLIKDAEKIEYGNDKLDAIMQRAEMLLRKIFGDKTNYIESLKDINFWPIAFSSSTQDSTFVNSYNNGKKRLINLLNVIVEDLQIDNSISEKDNSISEKGNTVLKTKQDNKKVFLVHGHDNELKETVARFLEKIELEPIILHEQANKGRTIIEKFEEHADVPYAIVLMTPDDVGNSKKNKENLNLRARQNVIFELGYFFGKLGRENVCALLKDDIEKPSDYDGITYIKFDENKGWHNSLARELKEAGMNINMEKIFK